MRRVTALFLGFSAAMSVMGPAQADYNLRVWWPQAIAWNPSAASYEVTVSDDGPGDLEARWGNVATPLPHHGSATIDLTGDGTGRIEIYRCAPTCEWAGMSSPRLGVFAQAEVTGYSFSSGSPATVQSEISLLPAPTDGHADVTWSVLDGDGPGAGVLATGTISVGTSIVWPGSRVTSPVEIDLPAGLPEQDLFIVYETRYAFEGGVISGVSPPQPISIDVTGPSVTFHGLYRVVYPVTDHYRDSIRLAAVVDESSLLTVEVLLPSGWHTITTGWAYPDSPLVFYWRGRTAAGPLPAGDYTVRVSGSDRFGNHGERLTTVSVDLSELTYVPFEIGPQVPRSQIIDRHVDRCSTLASPSRRGWPGSLGYYSKDLCQGSTAPVWTGYRSVLPPSYQHQYRGLGLAAFAAPIGADNKLWVVARYGGRLQYGTQEDIPVVRPGWVSTRRSWDRSIIDTDAGVALDWRAGTASGDRVDVKLFRIDGEYLALVAPDGTISIPTD